MTEEGKQKLTLVADAQGFDEAAKKVAKVTQAQAVQNFNQQNARFIGPDADSRRRRTMNGESRSR